jgi:hypothetical protein
VSAVLVAAAGIAFCQPSPEAVAQGEAQRRVSEAKAGFQRDAELARQGYTTCRNNNYYPGKPPLTCQDNLNAAAFYDGMAAAVDDTGVVPPEKASQLRKQLRDNNEKTRLLTTVYLAQQNYNLCLKAPGATANSCQRYQSIVAEYQASAAYYTGALPTK